MKYLREMDGQGQLRAQRERRDVGIDLRFDRVRVDGLERLQLRFRLLDVLDEDRRSARVQINRSRHIL